MSPIALLAAKNFLTPNNAPANTDVSSVYREAPWIEIEAKRKEEAIAHLRSWWVMGK